MAGITGTSTGIGTGLNTGLNIKSLVDTMVAAQKAPKEGQLSRLEKTTVAKLTGIGQFKSALSELQTALKDLNKPEAFQGRSVSSSDTKLVSATADKTALAGTYQVTVDRLATASKVATQSFESDFATTGAGKLTVQVGDGDGVEIDVAAGASLVDVRDAINAKMKEQDVSANVVTDPASGKSRLVLTSTKSGDGNDLSISTSGAGLERFAVARAATGSAPADLSSDDASGAISVAGNARFSIDGLALSSPGNTVENAIPGVTLNLASADSSKSSTIKVSEDREGVTSNIRKFVDAYNKLITTTSSLTGVTPVDGGAPVTGALVGDASVRNLLSAVRGELGKVSGEGDVRILSDLGITTQKDGTLAIDDTKLNKALDQNFEGVAGFFTGDNGLMTRVNNKIDPYIQTGGILAQREQGLNATKTSVDEQRVALDRRMTQLETRLYAQFNAMDLMVGKLNETSTQLEQSLKNLPGVVKSTK